MRPNPLIPIFPAMFSMFCGSVWTDSLSTYLGQEVGATSVWLSGGRPPTSRQQQQTIVRAHVPPKKGVFTSSLRDIFQTWRANVCPASQQYSWLFSFTPDMSAIRTPRDLQTVSKPHELHDVTRVWERNISSAGTLLKETLQPLKYIYFQKNSVQNCVYDSLDDNWPSKQFPSPDIAASCSIHLLHVGDEVDDSVGVSHLIVIPAYGIINTTQYL